MTDEEVAAALDCADEDERRRKPAEDAMWRDLYRSS